MSIEEKMEADGRSIYVGNVSNGAILATFSVATYEITENQF